MKKTILFAGLMMVAAMFIGCNNEHSPYTSTTKLWPACSVSKDAQGIEKYNWGYIDEKGNFAIPASYAEANEFSCGYASVYVSDKLYYIDEKNNIQNAPEMENVGIVYFLYDYLRYVSSSGLYGMLNKSFEIVIQPAYVGLGVMTDGGLVAFRQSKGDKVGFLNKKGEVVITPLYDYANDFDAGYAVVTMGDSYGVIDKTGEFTYSLQSNKWLQNVGGERIGFYDQDNKKYGLMDGKGNIVVQAIFDEWDGIGFTDADLMAVESNEKWGYIDKNGKIKIAQQFAGALSFCDGKAWVKRTETSNYETIDENGKTLLTLGKNEAPRGMWRQGLCLVAKLSETDYSYEYRYINEKGATVYTWKVSGANVAGGGDDWDAPVKKAFKNGNRMNNIEMMKGTKWAYRTERI